MPLTVARGVRDPPRDGANLDWLHCGALAIRRVGEVYLRLHTMASLNSGGIGEIVASVGLNGLGSHPRAVSQKISCTGQPSAIGPEAALGLCEYTTRMQPFATGWAAAGVVHANFASGGDLATASRRHERVTSVLRA